MTTVLLTGAAGLLGRELLGPLSARYNVIAVDARPFRIDAEDDVSPATALAFDLRDYGAVYETFARNRIDFVVHAGAISHPGPSFSQPVTSVQTNFDATVTLLEAATLFSVKRFVFISSIGVYGAFEQPNVREDHPMVGNSPYGVTKIAAELMGKMYAKKHALSFVALRYSHIYGPDRQLACPIKMLVDAAVAGQPLRLPSGADTQLHLIYQFDTSEPVLRCLERDPHRQEYNIGDGSTHRLEEVVDLLKIRVPKWEVALGPGPLPTSVTVLPPEEGVEAVIDVTRATLDLDFRANYDIANGINDYFDHAQERSARPS